MYAASFFKRLVNIPRSLCLVVGGVMSGALYLGGVMTVNHCGYFKRNFFCGTGNVEEDVEDFAFPVFGFCQDHSSRGLTYIILILQFQDTISGVGRHLNKNMFSVLSNILRCGICCLKNNCPGLYISVLRFIWVHHVIRMDVPKTRKIVPKSWIYDYP